MLRQQFCFFFTASKLLQSQTEYQTNKTRNNEEQKMEREPWGDAVTGRKQERQLAAAAIFHES